MCAWQALSFWWAQPTSDLTRAVLLFPKGTHGLSEGLAEVCPRQPV